VQSTKKVEPALGATPPLESSLLLYSLVRKLLLSWAWLGDDDEPPCTHQTWLGSAHSQANWLIHMRACGHRP
jgi:hypothetical protein